MGENTNNLKNTGIELDILNESNSIFKKLKYPAYMGVEATNTQNTDNEIGYYDISDEVIDLQNSVNFSRLRIFYNRKHENFLSEKSEEKILTFISATNIISEIEEQYHKFNYPQDYQWLNESWEALDPKSIEGIIVTGNAELDFKDSKVIEEEYSPIEVSFYTPKEIDIETELEVNYQNLLKALRKEIVFEGIIDIGLRIPYSLKERAKEYEIRLVKFLRELNITPRININLSKPEMEPEHRNCFLLTYLQFVKRYGKR